MHCKELIIRPATEHDTADVREIEIRAFGRNEEADLVDSLVIASVPTISLLAECDGVPIGHILLTEIKAPLRSLALAPLAVVPEYREMLVGTQLVRAGIAASSAAGFEAIFVLGDPLYYERFGFSVKKAAPFKCKWTGPHFMLVELAVGALAGRKGKLEYPDSF